MIFSQKVIGLVEKIPRGRVATYGQIASLASSPRAARVVGFILHSLPQNIAIPWQRVINSRGMISIENMAVPKQEQARRLQEEGIAVEFKNGNYWVDLKIYLWDPYRDSSGFARRSRGAT